MFSVSRLANKLYGKRFFASDRDLLRRMKLNVIVRESQYEPRANELIVAIKEKKYEKAKELVFYEKVNVNGHTRGEDTPLTKAAAEGDVNGVKFLLTALKANPHASCDCPHHKTALHYAAENGHEDVVEVLVNYGANPNVKDSRNYFPCDVARNEKIKKLLIEQQSKPHFLLIGSK